jgi:hypothetical protein
VPEALDAKTVQGLAEAGDQLMSSFKYEGFQDYYSISFKSINSAVQIRIFPSHCQQL